MRVEADYFWQQALQEMEDARVLFPMHRWAKTCFCAEQAAEMALKAVFIETKARVHPREHDLRKLAGYVNAPAALGPALDGLDPLYMETRYPDVGGSIPALAFDETKARQAFGWAVEILRWCASELRTHGPDLKLD